MKLTAEISMYPFAEDYRTLIGDFIRKLNEYEGFSISTSPTSTIVAGDYVQVMNMLTEMLAWSHETHGRAVFVTKFIPGYSPE